jgi:hypothetical protein
LLDVLNDFSLLQLTTKGQMKRQKYLKGKKVTIKTWTTPWFTAHGQTSAANQ